MHCEKCSKEIKDGFEFCMECGTKVEQSPTPIENKKINFSKKQKIIASIVIVVLLVASIGLFSNSLNSSPIKGVNNELYNASMEMITYYGSEEYIVRLLEALADLTFVSIPDEIDSKYLEMKSLCKSEEDEIFYEAFGTVCDDLFLSALDNALTTEINNMTLDKSELMPDSEYLVEAKEHIYLFKTATTVEELEPLLEE